MVIVILIFHYFDISINNRNLLEGLFLWAFIFPMIIVGVLWLIKPRYYNKKYNSKITSY